MSDDLRQTKPGNPPTPEEQTDFAVNPKVGMRSPLDPSQVGTTVNTREYDDAE